MHLFKHKNTKITLGIFAFLVVVAVAFSGNLLNVQGKTKPKEVKVKYNQQATSSSIQGAIKVSTNGSGIQYQGINAAPYTFELLTVYTFEVANNYSAEIKLEKITAEYSQEGFSEETLRKTDAWKLFEITQNYTSELTESTLVNDTTSGDYGHIPFDLNEYSNIKLKPGEKKYFAVKTLLLYDPEAEKSTDEAMLNVWLQEDTTGQVSPGPVSGSTYEEVDKAGSHFIFSTAWGYYNSAYPSDSNQAVKTLPTQIMRTSCGPQQGCGGNPTSQMTTGELIQMMWENFGSPNASDAYLECPDVQSGSEYYNAFNYAIEQDWINVYSDGSCHPENMINRAEAAGANFSAYELKAPTSYQGYYQDILADAWYTSDVEGLYETGAGREYGEYFYPDNILDLNDYLNDWVPYL